MLISLTTLSLTAYGCGFKMDGSSVVYMLHLIYFRSSRCHREINWENFDGINNPILLQPTMPPETTAVTRTMYFSLVYLCAGFVLFLFTLLALGENSNCVRNDKILTFVQISISAGMRKTHRSRFRIFICYFFPFIFIIFCLGVFDVVTSGLYIFDHFYSYNIDGLMNLLEIANTDMMKPIFLRVEFSTRVLPSLIIFGATSGFIILLIFQFYMIVKLPSAAWRVCDVNQHYLLTEETQTSDESEPPANPPTLNVGHESHF